MISSFVDSLKLTAIDLLGLGIIDEIIKEPAGGSHRDYETSANSIKSAIKKHLEILLKTQIDELLEKRYQKFRKIGIFEERNEKS